MFDTPAKRRYHLLRVFRCQNSALHNSHAVSQAKGAGLAYIGAGTILTSMALAGLLLGYALDSSLDTLPLFMLVFGCLGFVGGMLNLCKLLSEPQK